MACTIYFNGKQIGFNDEYAFDAWLSKNKEYIKDVIQERTKLDDIFDISIADSTRDKLNNYFNEMNTWKSGLSNKATLSPSKAPGLVFSDKNIIEPAFKADNQKIRGYRLASWKALGRSESDFNKEIKDVLAYSSWEPGSWFHRIMSETIAGKEQKDIHYNTAQHNGNLINYIIDPKAVNDAKNISQKIIDKLNNNYGMTNWDKFAEKPIGLKYEDFTEDFKALCEQVPELKSIAGIYGLCDLITINKNTGHLNIFDYKTVKNLNNFGEDNIDKAAIQLTLYAEALKRAGFKVDGIYVVPIEVSIEMEQLNGKDSLIPVMNKRNGKYDITISGVKLKDNFDFIKINSTNKYVSRISKFFKYKAKTTNDDLVKVNNLFKSAFYNLVDEQSINYTDEDIKKFVEKAKTKDAKFLRVYKIEDLKNDERREKAIREGYRFFVYRNKKLMGEGDNEIFFKSDTGDEIDEFLTKWIKKSIESRSELFSDFGDEFKDLLTLGDAEDRLARLTNLASDINHSNPLYIVNIFRKYAQNDWELISNDELHNDGIYIFDKNGRTEIVCLSNLDLFRPIKLKKGSQTILQNIIYNDEVGTDTTKTLNTLYGNFLNMKVMMLLAQNPTIIKPNSKVQAIRIANLRQEQSMDQSLNLLVDTWQKFVLYWTDKSRTILDDNGQPITREEINLLTNDVNGLIMQAPLAYVNRAYDVLDVHDENVKYLTYGLKQIFNDINNLDMNDTGYVEILKLIKQLKNDAYNAGQDLRQVSSIDFNTPYGFAYLMLNKALMSAATWDLQIEPDLASIFDKCLFDGTHARTPAASKSSTMRITSSMMSAYREQVRSEYNKRIVNWQTQLHKTLEERGIKDTDGDLRALFKDWFEEDGMMRIKNPWSDPYFQDPNRKEEKKLAILLVEDFNEYRGKARDSKDGNSLEIPLLELNFWDRVKSDGNIKEALKKKADSFFDWVKKLHEGRKMSSAERKNRESIDENSIKDYYFSQDSENREKELQKNGEGAYSHDLDTIYLYATSSNVTEAVSARFLPYFTAMRAVLAASENIDRIAETQIMKAVEDFIKKAVFEKSIVEVNHQWIVDFLNLMKSVTSWTTLAWNITNFTRENFVSFFRTNIALGASTWSGKTKTDYENSFEKAKKYVNINDIAYDGGSLFISKVTPEKYSESLGDIILSIVGPGENDSNEKSAITKKKMRLYSQLNMVTGMTGVAARQLADKQKQMRRNTVDLDGGYFTTTWPDYIHRNAILHAYLKTIGAFDAYDLDENGLLKYDMEKDKRYKTLLYYGFSNPDFSKATKEAMDRYAAEKQAYIMNLKKWRRNYPELKYGDYLPQALNTDEMGAIRNWADTIYGSYDPDTKALMQSQVLGSLFFQYKNYGLQMLAGWLSEPTHIASDRLVQMTTADGKKVYKLIHTAEEIANGSTIAEFITEDELTNEMLRQQRVEPYMCWEGDPFEGKLNTMFTRASAMIKGDEEWLNHLKNSPIARYNVFMTLWDSLIMLIIQGIIAMIYGKEKIKDIKNQDWWTRWTYTVFHGMATDGPLLQTLNSVIGDASMPMIGTLQTYYRNAMSLITGKKNAAYAFLNSFGATRTLTSFVRDITED